MTTKAIPAALALLVASCLTAWPQRVTLDVTAMPLLDVLNELRVQTGFEFRFTGGPPPLAQPGGLQRTPDRGPLVTLSVQDMPLKRALEEIGSQTGRAFVPDWGSYFCCVPRPLEGREVPQTEVRGYRIRVRSVVFSLAKQDFEDRSPVQSPPDPRMTMELEIDAPETDAAARLFTLDGDLRLVDDAGRAVPPRTEDALGRIRPYLAPARNDMHLPDPTLIRTKLDWAFPSPEATSLSLSGSLLLWRKCEPVEITLPVAGGPTEIEAYGIRIGGPRAIPNSPGGGGVVTSYRPYPPLELTAPRLQTLPDGVFALACADGRRVPQMGPGFSYGRSAGPVWWSTNAPPTAIVLRTHDKADPSDRVSFVIADIRLPDLPGWTRALAEEAARETADRPPHPYFAAGDDAGRVEFDLQVDDEPLPGPMSVPVSLVERAEGFDIGEYARWQVAMDERGHVRLDTLKPATYQLRVEAYSLDGLMPDDLGARLDQRFGILSSTYTWINTSLNVEVRAGQTTHLPAIRFVPAMQVLRPAMNAVVRQEELVFCWKAYPSAARYRVSLAVNLAKGSAVFWASDPTDTTYVRYDPTKGKVYSESLRKYLQLDPTASYHWLVWAYNAKGEVISQGHGVGSFKVE